MPFPAIKVPSAETAVARVKVQPVKSMPAAVSSPAIDSIPRVADQRNASMPELLLLVPTITLPLALTP